MSTNDRIIHQLRKTPHYNQKKIIDRHLHNFSYQDWQTIIQIDGAHICRTPPALIDQALVDLATEHHPNNILLCPVEFMTQDNLINALSAPDLSFPSFYLEQIPSSYLEQIPSALINPTLASLMVEAYPQFYNSIPYDYYNHDMKRSIVTRSSFALRHIQKNDEHYLEYAQLAVLDDINTIELVDFNGNQLLSDLNSIECWNSVLAPVNDNIFEDYDDPEYPATTLASYNAALNTFMVPCLNQLSTSTRLDPRIVDEFDTFITNLERIGFDVTLFRTIQAQVTYNSTLSQEQYLNQEVAKLIEHTDGSPEGVKMAIKQHSKDYCKTEISSL